MFRPNLRNRVHWNISPENEAAVIQCGRPTFKNSSRLASEVNCCHCKTPKRNIRISIHYKTDTMDKCACGREVIYEWTTTWSGVTCRYCLKHQLKSTKDI